MALGPWRGRPAGGAEACGLVTACLPHRTQQQQQQQQNKDGYLHL